jgi:AraC-like DNA-binding protein
MTHGRQHVQKVIRTRLLKPWDIGRTYQAGDDRVLRVMEAIESELAGDLSIAALAQKVHLSPSRLAHLFRDATGCSLHAYVRSRRIEKAASLLATGDLRIKQIAALVGFQNSRHFSEAFECVVGLTPSTFRKNSRNPAPE